MGNQLGLAATAYCCHDTPSITLMNGGCLGRLVRLLVARRDVVELLLAHKERNPTRRRTAIASSQMSGVGALQ